MYNPELDKPTKSNKKIAIIDFDTPLVQAALAVQESYIMVKHTQTGWEREFKNVTTFYGRSKARDKGWIGEQNQPPRMQDKFIKAEDFEITHHSRLTEEDHIAFGRVNNMFNAIVKLPWVSGFKILVGGKGNFRDEEGHITKYKGDRPEKPIRFDAVKQYVLNKYKDHIVQEDGVEADDVVGWFAVEGLKIAKETGRNPYVLAFVDKDLLQLEAHVILYNKEEMTVFYNDSKAAALHFFKQMLAGDSTDCIVGLPNFDDKTRTKYELRKGRGIGMATAEKYLEPCETVKEMAERTTEAYKDFYGEEQSEFTCWRGNVSQRNYIDYMNENSILLRMQAFKGHKYKISDTLKKLGII